MGIKAATAAASSAKIPLFAFIADNPSDIGTSFLTPASGHRDDIAGGHADPGITPLVALDDPDPILGHGIPTSCHGRHVVGTGVDFGISLNTSPLASLGTSRAGSKK